MEWAGCLKCSETGVGNKLTVIEDRSAMSTKGQMKYTFFATKDKRHITDPVSCKS